MVGILFSVLIPLFNSEDYIGICLDSVLSQNFDDYEIVIVDDGSTDNSGKICDDYHAKNQDKIRVIHKENEGVLLTRRRAIKEAKGEYLLWIDSDDCYNEGLLNDLYKEIKKNAPDMLIWNYETVKDGSNEKETVRSLTLPNRAIISGDRMEKIYEQMLIGRDMNELWTKCFKRSLVDVDSDYTEFKHVKMGDDLFCLFPIMDKTKTIEYLDREYYYYRIVDSSITHTKNYKNYFSYRTIFERADQYLKKWQMSKDVCQKTRDQFANKIISCISESITAETGYKSFKEFAERVNQDEAAYKIYTMEKRKLSSRFYQICYGLLTHKKYRLLYCLMNMIVKYR